MVQSLCHINHRINLEIKFYASIHPTYLFGRGIDARCEQRLYFPGNIPLRLSWYIEHASGRDKRPLNQFGRPIGD